MSRATNLARKMKIHPFSSCALALAFAVSLPAIRAQEYTITDLGSLPGYGYFHPMAINASGQIVGAVADESGYHHGAFYHEGVLTSIDPLPGDVYTSAYDINDAGVIAAASFDSLYLSTRYFTVANGVVTDLDALGEATVISINASGQLAYTAYYPDAPTTNPYAYLRTGGTIQFLGTVPGASSSHATGLNDLGQVVGYANNDHAILYDGSGMIDLGTLPGDTKSYATDINNAGTVIGVSHGNNATRVFVYSDGVMTDLFGEGNIPGIHRSASGINASGAIVGDVYDDLTDLSYAFLSANGGIIDLNTRVPLAADGAAGFTHLLAATALNDNGQIVGYGTWDDGLGGTFTRGFLLTPVPEPASLALIAGALALFGVGRATLAMVASSARVFTVLRRRANRIFSPPATHGPCNGRLISILKASKP